MSAHCLICDKDVSPGPNSIACPDCGSPIPELRNQSSGSDALQSPEQAPGGGQKETKQAVDPRKISDESRDKDDDDSGAGEMDEDESRCPSCGAEIEPSFKFCPQCTEPLSEDEAKEDSPLTVCPECGYDELTGDEQFCPMCTEELQGGPADIDGADSGTPVDVSDGDTDGPEGPIHSPGSGGSELELDFDDAGTMKATDETVLGHEIRKHLHTNGFDTRAAKKVSRQQLLFKRTDRGFVVVDLESSNGTELNGEALEPNEEYAIEAGDELEIAGVATASVGIN